MEQTEFGSIEAAALGGKARAKLMSDADRRDSARKAAEARWAKHGKTAIPRATHEGNLIIGKIKVPCCVLDDGTRLITQRGFLQALGRHPKANVRPNTGEEQVPPLLQGKSIKPFIDNDLLEKSRPVDFITPHGQRASGYRAVLLPSVCEIFLRARDAGELNRQLQHVAVRAEILIRGLARVGIIALVDEATGYQDDRDRRALAKILEAFVAKELRPWVHTFPADYYRELFRMRGLAYPPKGNKMPQYFGVLTNDIVYRRLAPGVLAELRRVIPRDDKGRLKHHLHRRLTDDVGHPKLLQHLGSVVTLMKMSDDKDYAGFQKLLDRIHPRQADAPLFDGVGTKQLTSSE